MQISAFRDEASEYPDKLAIQFRWQARIRKINGLNKEGKNEPVTSPQCSQGLADGADGCGAGRRLTPGGRALAAWHSRHSVGSGLVFSIPRLVERLNYR